MNSISEMVIVLFRFSASSWLNCGNLWVLRKVIKCICVKLFVLFLYYPFNGCRVCHSWYWWYGCSFLNFHWACCRFINFLKTAFVFNFLYCFLFLMSLFLFWSLLCSFCLLWFFPCFSNFFLLELRLLI